jgi:hypothetical protein
MPELAGAEDVVSLFDIWDVYMLTIESPRQLLFSLTQWIMESQSRLQH